MNNEILKLGLLAQNIYMCFLIARNLDKINQQSNQEWLDCAEGLKEKLVHLLDRQIENQQKIQLSTINDRISNLNQLLENTYLFCQQYDTILDKLKQLEIDLELLCNSSEQNITIDKADENIETIDTDITEGFEGTDPIRPINSSDLIHAYQKIVVSTRQESIKQYECQEFIPPYAEELVKQLEMQRLTGAEASFGPDNRKYIEEFDDNRNPPWRQICSLFIKSANPRGRSGFATGWFVGAKTIITAAHNLYNPLGLRGKASEITIYPGRDSTENPFGILTSSKFEYPTEWETSDGDKPDYDYGVIFLDDDTVGNRVGWLSFASINNTELSNATVNISGYPANTREKLEYDGTRQFYHADKVSSDIQSNRFFYEIDTSRGQSGSPVWIERGSSKIVVGIHTYGPSFTFGFRINSATRITSAVHRQINTWISKS